MSRRSTCLATFLVVLLVLFSLSACSGDESDPDPDGDGIDGDDPADGDDLSDGDDDGSEIEEEGEEPAVDPIFMMGCPEAGKSKALEITDPRQKMYGPDAIGAVGDILLMNEKAAFVIEAPEHRNAYYIYGGVLVDAVAVDGCRQASPDRFEEIGFLMGTFSAANYYNSVLRAFAGDSVEIVNDGSDGEAAVVRVSGHDDIFWLVEYELLIGAFLQGTEKGLSEPFGLDLAVNYILPPDSAVLQINLVLKNTTTEELRLIGGSEVMFGDTTPSRYYANSVIDIAGMRIDTGIPWMSASGGDGAWAVSMKDAEMMSTSISGVTAVLDFNQMLVSPLKIGPAGSETDQATITYFVAVGPTDGNSAVRNLKAAHPEPLPDWSYSQVTLEGTVSDAVDGSGVADVLVELQGLNPADEWMVLDSFHTDENGEFSGKIPNFGRTNTPDYRLVARMDGHPDSEPVDVDVEAMSPVELSLPRGGFLSVDIRDDEDAAIPAKILLYRDGVLSGRIYHIPGREEAYAVKPGDYEISVTRGYEYEIHEGDLTIIAGETTPLDIVLAHLVDTDGYFGVDTHCHAGPSPDNTISVEERIRTVAAEGLDVVVSTDHEFVSDWYPAVESQNLEAWVATVVGQEVTASLPNHTNAYPLEVRYDVDARGGYVHWYGLDIAEIYAAERARGAQIVQLNHPRNGKNYMSLVGYDPLTGEPALTDPTLLGLPEDAVLWDWDFDTIEYMNDPEYVFIDESRPGEKGLFDDWMSFLNMGRRKTAVGVSDAHNYAIPGRPRNYYPTTAESTLDFDEAEMVAALKGGRSMVSAGAFARVRINDEAEMGDTVTDTDGEIRLWVHIEAIPEVDVQYFKVYVNCDQALAVPASDPDQVVKYDGTLTVPVTEDAHVVVLAFGEDDIPRGLGNYNPEATPRVTTNAIFVDVDGNGEYDAPGLKICEYDLEPPATE